MQGEFNFYTQLGSNYSRPMYLADNKRFVPSIHRNFGAGSSSGRNAFPDGAGDVNLSGGTDPGSEGGDLLAKRPSGWFCLPTISGPKKDGGFRPVVNLKSLNKYTLEEHFKIEGFHMVRDLVRQGDLLAKIDLFPYRGASLSPEVSPVYLEGKSVPVPVTSIWTLM